MKFLIRLSAILFFVGGISNQALAQEQEQKDETPKSVFDKYEAFSPLFMTDKVNAFHSATGNPGPKYWQNNADYKIKATLDTVNHTVKGSMTLTYHNNSPYDLEFLWLQLDQNTFRKDSRGSALYPTNDRNGVKTYTDGYELKNVSIKMNHGKQKADYNVTDTRMQIRLPESLEGDGKDMEISIDYSFKIPEHGKDRMGRVKTENGWLYTIAQWYPRMSVLDEEDGWNTMPYLGTGEFYLEFGDFDYEITAPANMIVVGAGELENPKDVLTKYQRKQLDKARKSDETVMIRSIEDLKADKHAKGDSKNMLTWHFKMEQSHDIAWAASKAFIWDAARINLPDGKKALAQSVYPVENSGQDGYGRSTEYTKYAIELPSNKWYPYTYPVATNVGGHEGGMEYPGIVFCSYKSKNASLWGVINHEFGHNWFPMIVGSNERKYAWMDEGLNTFINDVHTEEFNNGEYHEETDFQGMGATMMFADGLDPLMTVPDVIHNQRNLGIEAYYKPSTGLHVLRNVILGKDRFDYAFKTYIKRWAFKHPKPWDFFNTMNNAAGENLDWFWKGWFMHDWKLDQAIESVDYVDGDPTKGAEITLLNKEKLPMPTTLKIIQANDQSETIKLPVEIWMTGSEYVYHYPSTSKIVSVEIDPDHLVPDLNPQNNKLVKLMDAPTGQNAEKVIKHYVDAIGGKKALENVKDMSMKMSAQVQGAEIEVTMMKKQPKKYMMSIFVPMINQNVVKYTVNGDDVNVMSRGEKQEVTDAQKETIKKDAVMFPELNYLEKGYDTELLGVQNVNGKKLYVLQVETPSGATIKDYYDMDSGLKMTQEVTQDGNLSKTEYSDYQTVKGVKIPYEQKTNAMGQNLDMKVKEVKINDGVKDSNFE